MTPEKIAFRHQPDGDSKDRADPHNALIERMNRYGWRILLPDGTHTHHVLLVRDGPDWYGRCHSFDGKRLVPCKGHKYGRGPCAHLNTLWRADFIGVPDIDGEPVHIAHADDDLDVGPAEPQLALADGGVRR